MITKGEIKEFEFDNINGIFDYILESIVNGQKDQARELIDKMSTRQRNWFEIYLDQECPFHHSYVEQAKKILWRT